MCLVVVGVALSSSTENLATFVGAKDWTISGFVHPPT